VRSRLLLALETRDKDALLPLLSVLARRVYPDRSDEYENFTRAIMGQDLGWDEGRRYWYDAVRMLQGHPLKKSIERLTENIIWLAGSVILEEYV